MKIKIIKESKKAPLEEEQLDEVFPAAAAAIGPLVKQLGPMLMNVLSGGGKDDAEELVKLSRSDPLVVRSKDMQDIKNILQAIQAQLANIDVSVDTAATGAGKGKDPAELDRAQKKSGRNIEDLDTGTSPADKFKDKLGAAATDIGTRISKGASRLGSAASKLVGKFK